MNFSLVSALHIIASALESPVIFILIALVVVMVVIVGMLVAEVFTERRYFRLSLPVLIDDLQHSDDIGNVVRDSGMLGRQKHALLELLRHQDATENELESLAVDLVFQEQAHFETRVKVTDFIAKAAPMFGLMGTLIPLGPGIAAIGGGDTQLLSTSLAIAFDTTVLGLIVAAVALLVSTIRKSWYAKYMSAFEAAAECVLEKACEQVKAIREAGGAGKVGSVARAGGAGQAGGPDRLGEAVGAERPGQAATAPVRMEATSPHADAQADGKRLVPDQEADTLPMPVVPGEMTAFDSAEPFVGGEVNPR